MSVLSFICLNLDGYLWLLPYSGKFLRMVNLHHFMGLIFQTCILAHYVLYSWAYFAGLIFVATRSSARTTKIGPFPIILYLNLVNTAYRHLYNFQVLLETRQDNWERPHFHSVVTFYTFCANLKACSVAWVLEQPVRLWQQAIFIVKSNEVVACPLNFHKFESFCALVAYADIDALSRMHKLKYRIKLLILDVSDPQLIHLYLTYLYLKFFS